MHLLYDLWKENCCCQRIATLGDGGRCSVLLDGHIWRRQTRVWLRHYSLILSPAGSARSEHSDFHPERVMVQETVKFTGLRAQKSLLVSPSVALCAPPAAGFHTGITGSDPVTSSWIREHLSRKSLSGCAESNDRAHGYPAPGCSCWKPASAFLGRCKRKLPIRQQILNYWFATQTSRRSSLLHHY